MPADIDASGKWAPLSEDEIWRDYYLRIRGALLINVSVTTYVFIESLLTRWLGLYVSDYSVGLGLAIGFYSALILFWILNETNYRKRKIPPYLHFYFLGVSLYLANLVAITDLVHLTGGVSSIYPFLFVFLALVGAFIAPQRWVVPLALLGMVHHGALLWMETTGIIATFPAGVFSLSKGMPPTTGAMVVFGLFSLMTLFGMFFGLGLHRIFEAQRIQLVEARTDLQGQVDLRTRDLTKAMEKLKATYGSLDLEKQRQERFFAHVTHQFRTPIHVINNFLSNFFNGIYGDITPRQVEALDHLSMCSQNLLQLINNLLDMSKIQSGKMQVQDQPGSVREQLNKLSGVFKPLSEAKKVPIRLEVDDRVADELKIDWVKLEAILINLLHNAIKFSKDSPVIVRVASDAQTGETVFQVEDFGRGVPTEAREKIFEAFEQHQPTSEFRGSGLGLYISRMFANLLGGSLQFRDKDGSGSTFELRLPRPDRAGFESA